MINTSTCFNLPLTIVQQEEGNYQLTWVVPEDLPYFLGHFPGNPICPGVALLDLCVEIIRIALKGDFKLEEVVLAKFMAPIVPLQEITIKASFMSSKNYWDFRFIEKEKSLCRLSIRLGQG